MRWSFGNGENIVVTKHFLLQIDYNFTVKDSKDFIVSNRRVSELLVEGERRWDAENIMNLFSLREYRAILSISFKFTYLSLSSIVALR